MATDTGEATEAVEPFEAGWHWRAGATAGFVATVAMGVAITVGDLAVLREAIAGLYAFEGNLLAGWLAHLAHGTLFGVVFAVVLSDPSLYRVSEWAWKTVLAGVVYALVLALAGAGFVMPIWLGVVGFGNPPTVPNVSAPLVGWHVLYGVVLGGAYAALDGRWRGE
ncbi:MAG: histidine kinase [Haloarculaceae archaeon]